MKKEKLDQDKFLDKYCARQAFERSGISWDTLVKIYDDYNEIRNELQKKCEEIVKYIKKDLDISIHSIQGRVKDSEHLIEKIIRKRGIEQNHKYVNINVDNYRKIIKDLIGIRILTLSKEEWKNVHDWLCDKFSGENMKECYMDEPPKAYTRYGDRDIFADKIEKEHSNKGYRSQHYVMYFDGTYCEIQVRTLAEEVYGEFDHRAKYPYRNDNKFLKRYTNMVSQFLDSVDEMISTCFQMGEEGWNTCGRYYEEDQYVDWTRVSQSVLDVDKMQEQTKTEVSGEKIEIGSRINNFILRRER